MNETEIMERQIVKDILDKNNIPYHFIHNRIYIYFKYISGRTVEINLDLKKQQYSIGICTSSNINMREHKILNEIFQKLKWL